jgi:hypothetical protein
MAITFYENTTMKNLTNNVSNSDLVLIHGAAKAAGICLLSGTTRIASTHQRWRPLFNLEDAISLMVNLRLSVIQNEDGITVFHFNAPLVTLAQLPDNSSNSFCIAVTTAAYNMSKRLI